MIAHLTEKSLEEKPIYFMDLQVGQAVIGTRDIRLRISENQYLLRITNGLIQARKREDWPLDGIIGRVKDVKMIWEISVKMATELARETLDQIEPIEERRIIAKENPDE